MKDEYPLLSQFEPNGSVNKLDIEDLERVIKFKLPEDYAIFMRSTNGGVGPIGRYGFARFWKLREILERNKMYEVSKYAPGLFLFGSDGGNEAFAFDTRISSIPIVEVTFISMGQDDIIYMAPNFNEFLEVLGNIE